MRQLFFKVCSYFYFHQPDTCSALQDPKAMCFNQSCLILEQTHILIPIATRCKCITCSLAKEILLNGKCCKNHIKFFQCKKAFKHIKVPRVSKLIKVSDVRTFPLNSSILWVSFGPKIAWRIYWNNFFLNLMEASDQLNC